MKRDLPVIAIGLGDPAGIGPEIVAKTLRDAALPKDFHYEVLGKKEGRGIHPGKVSRAAAQSAFDSLAAATQGCISGKYAAMVTGPVHKLAMSRLQPDFVGQTEYLARACGLPDEAAVMALTDPKLTVALCTNHLSLRNALKKLTAKRIVTVTKIARRFLIESGIPNPRLAFAGINPHLGEGDLFGDEDTRILVPAAEQLRKENIHLHFGPADTIFFYAVQRKMFDAVICAYHDQGLIPFKLVAFETGVNVTLGLPIIRTSPDHGTAMEIAGQGKADHRSMLAAVQLACRLVRGSTGRQ